MKREELKKLGLTDEQIDGVMNVNGEDINAIKAKLTQSEEQVTSLTKERDGLKTQVTDRDKDITELKKSAGSNEDLTKKLTDLQAKYETDTASLKKSLDDQAKDFAVEGLFGSVEFTSAFAKKAAIAEFKAANLEFKDGKFTGADDTIKKMREQAPDAFKVKEKEKEKDDGESTSGEGNPGGGEQKNPQFTSQLNNGGGSGGNTKTPFAFNFTPVRDTGKK